MTIGGGKLGTHLSATYMDELAYQSVKSVPDFNAAGWDFLFGAAPRVRGLGYVEFERDAWTVSYQARYVGHMKENLEYRRSLPDYQYVGWHEIDARWYQDIRLLYRFGSGLSASLAVNNLANEDPPFVAIGNGANTDMAAYPLLGRTYYLQLNYRVQ